MGLFVNVDDVGMHTDVRVHADSAVVRAQPPATRLNLIRPWHRRGPQAVSVR